MADAAQLKLQVGLDLAFFRQQLAQLGNTAAGYALPINIDRLGIQKEITKLGKNISNRSYTLKVKTTAAIAEAEVDKLKTALDNLQGKEVGIKITGTLGKIAPKDATKIRNDLAEAVAGGTGKKILVDVSVRENAIGEELRAVRKALNEKITPKNGKILVAASIRSGITNEEAKEFRESVKRKVGNIIVNVTGSADQLRAKEAKSIRASLYQSIISNGGKIKIPATLTIADSEVAAFQKAVNSKFAGITVKVKAEIEEIRGGKAQAQIEKEALAGWQRIQEMGAARMSGGVSDPARRESLRQSLSGRDIGELRNIGEQLGVKGARRYSNVQNLIEKIVADASIEMVKKYLDPQAVMRNPDRSGLGKVLDTFARGIFHMLGMDPTAMMAAQRQKLLPPAINWQSSVATPPQYQSKRGTMLTGAPAPTLIGGAPGPFGLLPRTTRAGAMGDMMRMLSQGAGEGQPGKLALSPEAAKARVDAIISQYLQVVEVQIKESFSAPAELKKQLNVFSYLAQSLRDAEQRVKQNKIDSAVDSLINALEKLIRKTQLTLGIEKVSIADLGANRPLLAGTSYPALPAAGETGKNRVRISTGNPFESLPLLPPVGGTTPRSQMPLHAVSTGAYVGQPPFMRAPSVPPSMATGGGQPPIPPSGGRGGSSGFGGFANAMAGIKLPGAGLISELGGEFAMAAKQVLLFGTAYKALAFLTDFPGKVGDAVGQLQTFRNTLTTVTGGGQEFGKSNKFILDLVEKYNVPLQSARDGFTKLYASMAPAGFKGDEIRNIFTGISQGAATFGMSADKVDRVNYAFAQMASKGQVMSEELKGQLGDVLPGAVAIFAEAAGFTGPEAMVKFTKAMEDGRYKGAAMKQLLINVGTVMNKEFGPGAEGAARTFQGLMNRMQNATLKLYEAFEPMAIGFANKVVLPMTDGLRVAADGFNAFFTGQQAVTKGGADLAAKLQELKPTFEGLAVNAKAVADRVIDLSKAFVPLLELGAKLLATPLAGFLAQTYVSVLLLNSAFTALGGRFAVTSMVAYFSRLNTALVLTQAQMIATGGAANAMSLRILAAGSTSVGAASATTQLTLALRAMWVAMTGPVGLGVAALAAVTAAAYLMNKPFKEYVDSIPDRFADFWRDLQSQATASISKVIKMWDSLATATSETFRLMIGSVSGFYDGLVAQLGPIAPWFGGMMQWLKNAWIETIAFMVNQSSPVLGIAKTLGVDVGKTLMVNLTKDRNLPAPGQFTPAGGVSFDAQGNPIGAPLSPFIPGGGALSPIPGATGDDSRGSAAKDAKRIAEQIKQQLKSAQDLKFEQQNRLTLLRAENDFTKAFTNFSIQRLEIERRYTELLKQSMSPEETAALQQARSAEYKQSSLTLQQRINELLKQSQAPLNDAVESIKNQVAFEREYGELIKNGTNPEVAKQILAIRKAYNESVKLLEPALAAAQAAVTKAKAEGASATEIQKYREELERIEAIRKGLAGKKAEGEAAAIDSNKPKTPTEAIEGRISTLKTEIAELTNIGNIAIKVADGIGAAFGQAFEGLITGSMSAQEALGNFFKSIGNMFIQMAAEIIAKQMTMIVLGFLMKALGLTAGASGGGKGLDFATMDQYTAPTTSLGLPEFANGAIFSGGIAKFATGGIVNGPTLFPFADGGAMQMGLMGEAGPEAIMPLQRGSDGSLGVRAAMGGNGMGGSSSPILNMSFETSTINGVEYVSRDQLEAAMAQTRRQASRDGANKGMAMTLDKIQQSPQTRRRIGM
jgi:tape measure domain-containing protein